MTSIRRWFHAALVTGVIASRSFSASAESPITVFLVRHAEKETNVADPPLAKRLGLSVTVVPAKDLDALLTKVRALPPGVRALIVSQSDTVPALAHRLTGAKVA